MDGFGGGDSLGSASGSIRLDAGQAIGSLNKFGSALNQTDQQARGWGNGFAANIQKNEQHINALGMALTGFGLAVAGGFGFAINTAAGFEQQMSAVGSVTGATGKELEALREEALRLGADTSFSASEAAVAMEVMAKAGVSASDIANGATEDILNLANATGVDVPAAAETAAAAMNVFGVSSEEAADVIARSANVSSLDVNDWALAMKSAAPVAASLGYDIEDLAAAMIILGDAGIKGEVAATALRNIMINMADPTGEAALALGEYGVAVTNADGSVRELDAVTADLAGTWGTLTDAQKLQLAQSVAGRDGAAAFMTIMDAQTAAVENNSNAFDDNKARMEGVGTASEQAKQRMDNFRGAWEEMKGSLETAMIVVGSRLLPAMQAAAEGIKSLINGFLELPAGVQKAITAVVGIAGALSLGAGAILLALPRIMEIRSALQALGGVSGVIRTLSTALRGLFLSNPLFIALAVAVAAFVAYRTNFLGFRDAVDGLVKKFKSLDIVKDIGKWAKAAAKGIGDFFDGFRDGWRTISGNPLERFLSSVQRGLAAIGGENTPAFIANLARGFGEASQAVGKALDIFNAFRTSGLNPVHAALETISTIFPVLSNTIDAVIANVKLLRDIFGDLADAFTAAIDGDWSKMFDELGEAAGKAGEMVKNGFNAIKDTITGIFEDIDWGAVGTTLMDGISAAIDTLGDIASDIGAWFSEQFGSVPWGDIASAAWDVLSAAGSWIVEKLGAIASAVSGWFTSQISGIGWGDLFRSAWNVLSAVGTWLVEKLGPIAETVGSWLFTQLVSVPWGDYFKMGVNALASAGTWLVEKMGDAIDAIQTWFDEQISGVNWASLGDTVGSKLRGAIRDGVQAMADIAAIVLSWIADQIRAVNWESVGSTFAELLVGGIKGIVGLVGLAGWLLAQIAQALLDVDWSGLATAFGNLLLSALQALGSFLLGFATTLTDELGAAIDAMGWSDLTEKVSGWAGDLWDGITSTLTDIVNDAIGMLNGLIDKLNMIPGVDIPKIPGIGQIGTDASAAEDEVVNLQTALANVATGKIFPMDDRSRAAAAQTGYTPYANPYNPTENATLGNGGSQGGIEVTGIAGMFKKVTEAARETKVAIDESKGSMNGLVDLSPMLETFSQQASTSFISTGTSARTNLPPIIPMVGEMAGALLTRAAPSFAALLSSAQTNFSGIPTAAGTHLGSMLSKVQSNTSSADRDANTNTASMARNVASNASRMATDAATHAMNMQRKVSSETMSMSTKSAQYALDMQSKVTGQTLSMQTMTVQRTSAMNTQSVAQMRSMAQAAVQQGQAMANGLTSGALQGLNGVRNAMSQIPGIISGMGGSAAGTARSVGANISNAMAQGMESALGRIRAAASAMVSAAETALRAKAMIASPSRLFLMLGEYVGEGFSGGILRMIPEVARATARMLSVPDASVPIPVAAYGGMGTAGVAASGITIVNNVFALKSEDWQKMVADAQAGASHARAWQQPGTLTQYRERRTF